MTDQWDGSVECCGNCAYWPLGGYQHDWKGAEPIGIGGQHTNGEVSDCRRHAPSESDRNSHPGATARWPTTRKRDFCGDFELQSSASPKGGPQPF